MQKRFLSLSLLYIYFSRKIPYHMSRSRNGIKLFWSSIPLIAALFFILPIRGIPVSPDGAWYSGLALNLYNGHGFVDLDGVALFRRPLFPIILAGAYTLFGPSPFSSLIVMRLFYLLSVLLIMLLARNLYSAWTGCVAGLLMVSSYALNEWSTWVNLDPILPAFILLFLLLFYLAIQRNSILLHLLSGIALTLAFLVKETALFYSVLPLLVLIFPAADRSRRQLFWGALTTWLGSALSLAPWLWYVITRTGDPWQVVGNTPQWASATLFNLTAPDSPPKQGVWTESIEAFLARVQNYASSFPNFYEWFLAPNFMLAPLLVLAFFVAAAASFRLLVRNSPLETSVYANRYLMLSVLVFTPMIVLQGVAGFRERQSMIVFQLLMIALAWLVTMPIEWWLQQPSLSAFPHTNARSGWRRLLHYALFGLALVPAVMLVSWQACCDRPLTMAAHLQNFNSITALAPNSGDQPVDWQTVRSPNPWWPTESMIRGAQSVAAWAEEEGIGPEQRILTHDNHHRYVNLFTAGKHHYFKIPTLRQDAQADSPTQEPLHLVLINATQPNATLWNNAGKDEPDRFTNLRIYTQEQILATVTEEQIDYVVVGVPEKWLVAYFLNHPAFQKVAEFEYGATHVFEVVEDNPLPVELKPTIDLNAANLLRRIKNTQPGRYDALMETLFVSQLGWMPNEVETAVAEAQTLAIAANSFLYPTYASWVDESQGDDEVWGYDAAVTGQQTKANRDPQNPWPHIALGSLYQHGGQSGTNQVVNQALMVQAADAYERALQLDPGNWRAAWRIVELHRTAEDFVDAELLATAVDIYQHAVEQAPTSERVFRELATLYAQLDMPVEAIDTYQKAIDYGVADAGTYLSAGWIYENTLDDMASAIARYAAGASVVRPDDPKYDQLLQHLGKRYVQEEKYDHAVALYQKAAYERVGVAWPHIELGKLYLDSAYAPTAR